MIEIDCACLEFGGVSTALVLLVPNGEDADPGAAPVAAHTHP